MTLIALQLFQRNFIYFCRVCAKSQPRTKIKFSLEFHHVLLSCLKFYNTRYFIQKFVNESVHITDDEVILFVANGCSVYAFSKCWQALKRLMLADEKREMDYKQLSTFTVLT